MSAGCGYTLATGRLFCDMAEFHAFAEKVAGRPILTHEFASEDTWRELREAFEAAALAELVSALAGKGD